MQHVTRVGHGHRQGQALPRQLRGGRADGRGVAVRPRPGHLRGGRQLPPQGCRRLHPRLVAAAPRPGPRPRSRIRSRCEASPDPLWAGRLSGGLDPAILDFTASLAVDRRLLPYDLRASAVHVRMLARQGLIDAAEADAIVAALARGGGRAGRGRRGRALRDRAAAGRAGAARARRPQPQRPGADGDAAVGEAGLRRPDRGRPRPGRRAARPRRRRAAMPCCRATPTASAHSRCGWASTWPPTSGRCAATAGGCARCARRPTCARWARARWPARACRSTRTGWPRSWASPARFDNSLDAVSDRDYLAGLCYAARTGDGAPVADRRGAGAVDVGRVRLRRARRQRRHRQLDDAAEEEPGRRRAGARQGRHRDRARWPGCWPP